MDDKKMDVTDQEIGSAQDNENEMNTADAQPSAPEIPEEKPEVKKARKRVVSRRASEGGPAPAAKAREAAPAVTDETVRIARPEKTDKTSEVKDEGSMEKTIVAASGAADKKDPKGRKSRARKARKRKAKAKKPLWKRILLTLFLTVLILGLIAGAGGLYIIYKIMEEAPPLDLSKLIFEDPSVVYDINGDFYQELQTSEKRENITIDQVPELVQLCFVSIEDQRFYSHFGVDIRGTLNAVLGVITTGSTEGMGGSTITQQLIKQTHLSSETTIKRKIKEWKLAYELEQQLPKRKILEAYLNKINLSYAWGVQSASNMYFGKDVSELTIAQAATLASILKAPTYYNPYKYAEDEDGNSYLVREDDGNGNKVIIQDDPSRERAKLVIDKMLELGHISEREWEIAYAEIDENRIGLVDPEWGSDYTFFTDAVYEEVLEDLQTKYSMTYDEAVNLMLNGGISIYSTIDPVVQRTLDRYAADDSMFPDTTYEADAASAAMTELMGHTVSYHPEVGGVVLQNSTSYVVGIVGGRSKEGSLVMNRALEQFQTGSSTKPCTAYAPAIDTGTVTLATTFDSIPLSYGGWTPMNFANQYLGLTTVRTGLLESDNAIAIQTEYLAGHELCAAYAERFGYEIEWDGDADLNSSALALGGFTYGQSPLTMASAFSTFPNMGTRTTPTFYRYVTDSDGNVILESEQESIQVIKPTTAWLLTDVMKGIADNVNGNQAAGKTGTTDYAAAVWFCGFTRDYTAAFWMGYDQRNVIVNGTEYDLLMDTTSYVAKSFWNHVMSDFYSAKGIWDTRLPDMPEGIVQASVDRVSGRLPSALSEKDPRGSTVYTEYFAEGTIPGDVDTYHREVLICQDTGLLATEYCMHTVKKVLVYKDPEVVYIAGGVPYRDDYKWGKNDAAVKMPEQFCTKCGVDTKLINFSLGTRPSDPTSILSTAYDINKDALNAQGLDSVMLYLYGVPATNEAVYVNNVIPVITLSDPTVAQVEWAEGEGLRITPLLNGTTTLTVQYTYNAGIESAVRGIPSATGEGQLIYPEYTATATIQLRVSASGSPGPGPGEPEQPDDPVDPGTGGGGEGSEGGGE